MTGIERIAVTLAAVALAILGGPAQLAAGTQYEVRCATPECKFKLRAGIGGGMAFGEASGYCAKCRDWVAVTWKRKGQATDPLLEFWDPATGEKRQLYKCPDCRQPFVAIRNISELKYCPTCKKPGLKSKRTLLYD